MKKINNVLICGLGAIGGYYASVFYKNNVNLKVLVDKSRIERYLSAPRVINGESYAFDYVLPEDAFSADLIIIATKSSGLDEAVVNIRNFVSEDTIILSFLNGISSEKKLIKDYGDKVLYSYLLGHTFFRSGNVINHDGNAKIVYGSVLDGDERVFVLKDLFDRLKVQYEISDDIILSQWKKFAFNCCVNQISAITRMTFGEMKTSEKCLSLMKNICDEISLVAQAEGVTECDFYKSTLESLDLMIPDGKTSMLQDVEAGVKPETDLFGGTVSRLGEKFKIDTPYNRIISEIIASLKFSL